MKRVVVGAVLVALTLIVLSPLLPAQELPRSKSPPPKAPPPKAPPPGGKGKAPKAKAPAKALRKPNGQPVGRYALRHGARLPGGGICYRGPLHRPWALRYYSPAWRLWLLFDPNTDQWYFWHPALRAYYPMSYLLTRPPGLQPPGTTPGQALNNVPVNVANVPEANGANVPNVPNVPQNLRGRPPR